MTKQKSEIGWNTENRGNRNKKQSLRKPCPLDMHAESSAPQVHFSLSRLCHNTIVTNRTQWDSLIATGTEGIIYRTTC